MVGTRVVAVLGVSLLFAACPPPPVSHDAGDGGGSAVGGGQGGGGTAAHRVGGTVDGLDPTLGQLELALAAQRLTVTANGPFTFAGTLAEGDAYDVRVSAEPTHQACSVAAGTGTVTTTDVNDIKVTCALRSYPLGGAATGPAGITLTETVSTQSVVLDAGTFRFPTAVPYGSTYDVAFSTVPPGWDCTLDGGAGTVLGPVTDISLACSRQTFTLGGTVTGLDAGLLLVESATAQQLPVTTTPFSFAQPIPYGTNVSVSIATHPASTFCRASNGTGTLTAPKTDVAIDCRPGFTLSGTITGLTGSGLVLREGGTLQTLSPDAGTFDFPLVVPSGDPYAVTIAAQPTQQSCVVSNGTGTATGPVRNIGVECFRAYPDLIVNEVSSAPAPGTPIWLELYNGTPLPKNLADYQLRTGTLQLDAGPTGTSAVFALPDAGIAPGRYLVVSSKPFADLWDSAQLRFLSAGNFTFWFGDGGADFVELRAQGGASIDSIALGPSMTLSAQQWSGVHVNLPGATADHGKSVARRPGSADTNTAADFVLADYPTPGGPNDALGAIDADRDGLPDSAEVPGGRYAGLPLYDWGARTGRRDLFVEIDWVRPDAGSSLDLGIVPRREALQRVHDAFAPHDLELHFDVGDLYDPSPGIDPADFDLGGGNETQFACTITLSGTAGATSFYALKAQHSDLRRRVAFHHVIFGNSLADVACGGVGSTGRAEQDGNDVVVTLGNLGLRSTPASELNRLINWQASTLMHELGHNLGLRHGGFENRNYKPNYLSVMNYLYQLNGVAVVGITEGDRYYLNYGPAVFNLCSGAPIIASPASVTNGRFSPAFGLDFSNGSSAALDEASLDETKGLGRDGGAVDWSLDNLIQSNVSVNINAANDAPPVCPRGSTGADVLQDNDDWSMITPYFLRTPLGSQSLTPRPKALRGGAEAIGDHHTPAIETLRAQ